MEGYQQKNSNAKGNGVNEEETGNNNSNNSLNFLSNLGKSLEYSIETNIDYGYGNIDFVWNVSLHPSLPQIKWGFVKLQSQEGGDRDWQDNQYSQRKIEEAIMRGLRSGMDRVYLIADNEDMARSISGKIEWLASFGSLVRFDAVSLGLSQNQDKSNIIVPSQERVPEGEKTRKEEIREREAKFDEHNRPKGDRAQQEDEIEKAEREIKLDDNSRPSNQKEYL